MKLTLLFGVAMLGLAGCAGTDALDPAPPEECGMISADGVQHVDLWSKTWAFHPNRIILVVGRPVELVLRRAPHGTRHNFVIDAPGAGITANIPVTDEPRVLRFTPTEPGLYHFYCDKESPYSQAHREFVNGNFEVLPADAWDGRVGVPQPGPEVPPEDSENHVRIRFTNPR